MSRNSTLTRLRTGIAAAAIAALALTGCAPADTAAPEDSTALTTITPGKLTIGTGDPAYSPWVNNFAPESGEGFEAAVAYAIAAELGFAAENVVWVGTTFEEAIAPGVKNFDFNLQQFTITEERKANVDFSEPYYVTTQAVVTVKGSAAEGVTDLAGLKGLLIGAASATTSFKAIEEIIAPTAGARAFNSNDDAKAALAARTIDAIVVDLPTAFYLSSAPAEFGGLDDGLVIGQLSGAGAGDSFGLVLDKGSALTAAVSAAIKKLRDSGKLAELEKKWLTDAGAPVLK
jgi:polar amino acid transport system substrate-binding protein